MQEFPAQNPTTQAVPANQTTNPLAAHPLAWTRWIPAVLLALIVIVFILVSSNIILIPLLSSLALAYLLAPCVTWFERRGWRRSTAVTITLAGATLVLTLGLIFVLPGLWDQLAKSYDQATALFANRQKAKPILAKLEQASPPVYKLARTYIERLFNPDEQARLQTIIGSWLQNGLFRIFDLTSSFLDLLLIPFFVYYLLSDYRTMRQHLESLVPPRFRTTASELISQINWVISSYVRNQLYIALLMGALYSCGFWALRVPLAFTIGMLSGLFNFIPYLGTLTGLALSLAFSALDGAGFARLGGIVALFALVQTIEGYYLTPKLLGDKLNLHPLWVLIGLVVGGSLFGLLGIILAVPIIAIAQVLFGFLETLYQTSYFYQQPAASALAGNALNASTSSEFQFLSPNAQPAKTAAETRIILPPSSTSTPRTVITTTELQSRRPKPKQNQ